MENIAHDNDCGCAEYHELSRRGFIGDARIFAATLASTPAWLPQVTFSRNPAGGRDTLVIVNLRGGMDGLTGCVPFGDSELYVKRPTLAVQPPGQPDGALDLDGYFGLPPTAAPLLTPYQAGKLAVVHATGSTDPTRSHFDAMFYMETGTPNSGGLLSATGWMGRHLINTAAIGNGDLRGIGVSPYLAMSLFGGPGTVPVPDLASYDFPGRSNTAADRRTLIGKLYSQAVPILASAATSALATVDILNGIDFANYVPENGATYPNTTFGVGLKSVAALIKADGDLEVAHLDYYGWDHHNGEGPINGAFAYMINDLAATLEAFYLDTQSQMDRLVVVVMSEFGRRIEENGTAGTDHGHGNCMFVMGGHVAGGQVLTQWPGLINSGNGDLDITYDYRDILAEILEKRMGNTTLGDVFPNYTPIFRGIIA
jgi:uncharacterized protein (DUF1501 family)